MSAFTDSYVALLIKQYYEQTNAPAEIAMRAVGWEAIRDRALGLPDAFDIDQAVGVQLDILGRIVGISRTIPFVLPKTAFGFYPGLYAHGFDDKFAVVASVAPFLDKFEPGRTALQLSDSAYRLFIKARIAVNVGGPYMTSSAGASLREVVSTIFSGAAWAVDNKDMTLTLYVDPAFDGASLAGIVRLRLLPKPQGVRYRGIILAAMGETFGFLDNPNALPMADKFDSTVQPGGRFARKVV